MDTTGYRPTDPAPAGPPAVRARTLRKTYGTGEAAVHALDGVDVGCGSGVHAARPSAAPSARPVAVTPQVRARAAVRRAVLRLGKTCTRAVPSV